MSALIIICLLTGKYDKFSMKVSFRAVGWGVLSVSNSCHLWEQDSFRPSLLGPAQWFFGLILRLEMLNVHKYFFRFVSSELCRANSLQLWNWGGGRFKYVLFIFLILWVKRWLFIYGYSFQIVEIQKKWKNFLIIVAC